MNVRVAFDNPDSHPEKIGESVADPVKEGIIYGNFGSSEAESSRNEQ